MRQTWYIIVCRKIKRITQMRTITTNEALAYLGEQTGLGHPFGKQRLNKFQQQGRISPHTRGGGDKGHQNTYTVDSLDALIATIKTQHRHRGKGQKPS